MECSRSVEATSTAPVPSLPWQREVELLFWMREDVEPGQADAATGPEVDRAFEKGGRTMTHGIHALGAAPLLGALLLLPVLLATAGCGETAKREALARMETSMGTIVLLLHEEQTPNTVANFMHLASKGFYDGVIFHRVIADFMIQTGCPEGTGKGGPGWEIADEFVAELRHAGPGVLSMANRGPNTGGSQFFITLRETNWLDGRHAVFGRVVEGMDVVTAIGSVKTGANNRPLAPVTIERITLLRDGQQLTGELPMPKVLAK
ncbi:MAG: peptidylprolyl isomerase [Planctomycetota bacterium]|jgi:cyclophilin family peptidyl-prolyl cis-trans isomerase